MLFLLPGFGRLFYATILCLNSIAILSEDRFFARIGWGRSQKMEPVGFGASHDPNSVGGRFLDLVHSMRYLRLPLIPVNLGIIVYELALG